MNVQENSVLTKSSNISKVFSQSDTSKNNKTKTTKLRLHDSFFNLIPELNMFGDIFLFLFCAWKF